MRRVHPFVRNVAFVSLCALPTATLAAQHRVAAGAPAPKRELSPTEQVAHVLSRLTFGARPGDAQKVAAMGVDKWIERQLHPGQIGDSDVDFALKEIGRTPSRIMRFPQMTPGIDLSAPLTSRVMGTTAVAREPNVPAVAPAAMIVMDPFPASVPVAWKIVRTQLTNRQLLEVITDFWENHFSVYSAKMPTQAALDHWERDVIRPFALGKFRDLLGSVAHSPAMLYYLDNHLSRRDSINENYARELLELHTLGVDGGYTQNDVIEVARAFTGWSIDPRPRVPNSPGSVYFRFYAQMHDTGAKSVLGHTLAAGRGIEDAEDVLDVVARHPSTARFIASKLARRLVSDVPPVALVERAAATFTRTDGDIAEVVRTIVLSEEFFSRAAYRSKVKTPFEFLIATLRVLDVTTDAKGFAARSLVEFGQPVFGRATPDGWPEYNEAWINSGAILKRVFFSIELLEGKFETMKATRWDGWGRYSSKDAGRQADGVIDLILGGTASPDTRAALLAASGSGTTRLQEMLVTALGSPDFQRR